MRKRGYRELWGLMALFAVFLTFATVSERVAQQTTTPDTPSSFNAAGQGVKALYLLLETRQFHVARLTTTWDALGPDDGLLVMIEPFQKDRPVSATEIAALRKWIVQGGSALYLATSPARPLDKNDTVFGDIAIVEAKPGEQEVAPETPTSLFTQGVSHLMVNSPVRLLPQKEAGYETLFQDEAGALALHKPLGKGHVLALALGDTVSNGALRKADNAVFLVQAAAQLLGPDDRAVLFDEYHHGVGFVRKSDGTQVGLLESMPAPLRLAYYYLIGVGVLLVYNGNRRFGRPRVVVAPAYHRSTDFIEAMARLYRRAGGADIALETLYKDFVRDLAKQLDLLPDVAPELLRQRAVKRFGLDNAALGQVMERCQAVVAGQRLGEAELLKLVKRLEEFRRTCHLVGN